MTHTRAVLTALASLFLAEFVSMYLNAFKGMSEQKAIGLGAVIGIQLETILSPLFWVVAILSYVLFFATSRIANGTLRVLFFWIPSILITALGVSVLLLFVILFVTPARHATHAQ